jgi:hypothetical protein
METEELYYLNNYHQFQSHATERCNFQKMEKVDIHCRPEKIAGTIRIQGVKNSSEWFKRLNPRNLESFLQLIGEEQNKVFLDRNL